MRTIKPQRLGVLHRTYEHRSQCWFSPSVIAAFDFSLPDIPLHEALLWRSVAETFELGDVFDEAMWKPHAEVLVSGDAFPPNGPAPACQVRVVLGDEHAPLVDKRLYAVGDRVWERMGSSDPEPFTSMPVRWSRAFGGANIPHGSLPNIENPDKLVRSPDDRPAPVGLGPRDIRNASRRALGGTYDDVWLKQHYPGFPSDIDWRFFNVAPLDQQVAGKLRGGERIVIENMHHDHAHLESRVPSLRARAFVTRVGDLERTLHEVILEADTLHLFPGIRRGFLFYRGRIEVDENDAADLAELLLAAEDPADPKPVAHYAAVLRRRTEGDLRALHALADDDLLPTLPDGVDAMGHIDLGAKSDDESLPPLLQNIKRRIEAFIAAERDQLPTLPEGMDPVPLPNLDRTPPRKISELVEMVEEGQKRQAQAQETADQRAKDAEAQAREQTARLGVDFDALMEAAKKKAGGPPTFSADAELTRLRELSQLSKNAGVALTSVADQLADPELADKLEHLEKLQHDNYRNHAHNFPEAQRLDMDASTALRAEVVRARGAGESLANRDLTGADLSGLDLSGVLLSGAYLENADLSATLLVGADLTGAVLARANLSGADLSNANLSSANLGKAKLVNARLVGSVMVGATLSEADLNGADCEGVQLDQATFVKTLLRGARLVRARARQLTLHDIDLSNVDCSGAELNDTLFITSSLAGANFRGARMDGSCLLSVVATGACFDDTLATNLRVVGDSDLCGASFRRADLTRANFRGARLRGCCFDEAKLNGADVSEADFEAGSLQCIRARELMATRTSFRNADLFGADLMLSILQKADIAGADLTQSNLFRADLAWLRGDDNTTLRKANVQQARMVRRKRS